MQVSSRMSEQLTRIKYSRTMDMSTRTMGISTTIGPTDWPSRRVEDHVYMICWCLVLKFKQNDIVMHTVYLHKASM